MSTPFSHDRNGVSRAAYNVPPQLLFPAIPAVPEDENNLTHKHDPEWHRPQRTVLEPVPEVPQTKAKEHLVFRGTVGLATMMTVDPKIRGKARVAQACKTRESLKEGHSKPTSPRRTFRRDRPPVYQLRAGSMDTHTPLGIEEKEEYPNKR